MSPGSIAMIDQLPMLFGHKERFAIEAMSEPHLNAPSRVWGRMRIWCEGHSVGAYLNQHCGLPYEEFRSLRDKLPSLWLKEFGVINDIDLFHLLDLAVFGCKDGIWVDDDRTHEQIRNDALPYSDFVFLTNWGEMFDGEGKLFLLCPDGINLKMLHQLPGSSGCIAYTAQVVEVREAIDGFTSWFEREQARLGASS